MRILIVDDLATNRKLLRITLEAEGYETVEAADGVEALAVLKCESVGVVISDILMPNMDGFRLCHEIRKTPELSKLPFVIYTSTYTSPNDVKLAKTVGADQYLAKPATGDTIMAAIDSAIQNRSGAVGLDHETSDEMEILKQYNQALVNKLEEKYADLERTVAVLHQAHERILELNQSLEQRVAERTADLTAALAEVKELTGLLPICCYCKKIRDDKSYWHSVESYVMEHSRARFSHSFCPECFQAYVLPKLGKTSPEPNPQPETAPDLHLNEQPQ